MAIGISPGKWIKIAPEAPNQFFNEGKANWKMLQSVVNTGIAFKLVAKIAGQTNEREAANRRAKVQHDVEHFKSFLLNITRAWEDLMHTEEETAPEVFERTTSEAVPVIGIPEREPFVTKAIATGLCKLFPRLVTDHDTVLDMDLLAFHPHYPWPMSNTSFQVMEAVQMGKKGARSSGKKQLDSCTFRMRTPGCDQITIRIWANGKTQTYGCKDRAMLEDANQCLASFIRHIDNYHRMSGNQSVWRLSPMQSAKAISCLDEVRILSAPLLGSWNINLKKAGIKLNMQALCEFLQQSMFEDRVYKVQFVAQKGNSSRFNNLSLYIRTSCLLTWKKDDDLDNHQDNVYVNVYESGKCSVLAVPDTEVAEELADVVSGMLYEALRQQPGISEEIQSTKRRKL
uniref:Uncharacterized protein n=1 Tax=Hanusia phi TaxID=3032 RepID=A0A7S0F1Y4_9CRYP|mmetsp:Transcript_35880/g.80803  ORF Transcript_35880/g.80803 Transcript_35880/m.80803 type:complete len:399 (+) Transcript_35880:1-1197(+)